MSGNASGKVVLITGARAPVALHWCRLFAAAGWRVIAADSLRAPLARFSTAVAAFEPLPSPRETAPGALAAALAKIVEWHGVQAILPTCEEIFHIARAAETPAGAAWREGLQAPRLKPLVKVHDKADFAQWVSQHAPAFATPFHRLSTTDDLMVLEGGADWVLKPCFSRFATDVVVRPMAAQRAALASRVSPRTPWLAQAYLPGEEVCVSTLMGAGRVLASQAYHPRIRLRGGVGAGVVFEAASEAVHRAVQPLLDAMAVGLDLRGAVSVDLRRDAHGQFRALECNPRSTSGLHFFGRDDGLVSGLMEGVPTTVRAVPGTVMGEAMAAVMVGGVRGLAVLPRLQPLSRWPGDSLGLVPQARAFAELLRIAWRSGCSVEEASTLDIRFDGLDDQDSVSAS